MASEGGGPPRATREARPASHFALAAAGGRAAVEAQGARAAADWAVDHRGVPGIGGGPAGELRARPQARAGRQGGAR